MSEWCHYRRTRFLGPHQPAVSGARDGNPNWRRCRKEYSLVSTNLQSLNLGGKQSDVVAAEAFSGLTSLRILDLSWIRPDWTSLPEQSILGPYQPAGSDGNELVSLTEGVFSGLTNLQSLNLGANNLTSLPERVFSGLTSLRILDLWSNQITSLPKRAFSGLTGLGELELSQNPGAPFPLVLAFERTDDADAVESPASVRLVLAEGTPFPLTVELSVQGGTVSLTTATMPAGSTEGPIFHRDPGSSRSDHTPQGK